MKKSFLIQILKRFRVAAMLMALLIALVWSGSTAKAYTFLSTNVEYTYTLPDESDYTANCWQMKPVDYTRKAAKAVRAMCKPTMKEIAFDRDFVAFPSDTDWPKLHGNGIPVWHSEGLEDWGQAAPLEAMGWTDYIEMSAMYLEDFYEYDRVYWRSQRDKSFEEWSSPNRFPAERKAEVHIYWPSVNGIPIFPNQMDPKRDWREISADLVYNTEHRLDSASFGVCLAKKEMGEAVTATVTPEECAQAEVDQCLTWYADAEQLVWDGDLNFTVTVPVVRLGYWLDEKYVANPGWLIEIRQVITDEEGTMLNDQYRWVIYDFATGKRHD